MLKKISRQEYNKYIDYIYGLSADISCSAFPIYADGVKTKELFLSKSKKGLDGKGEEILLYERDGKVCGWIHYYFIESDKYLGISSMLTEKGFGDALAELFQYWSERYKGFSWCFYLPSENREALDFMAKNGFEIASRDIVDVLLFKNYTPINQAANVIAINSGNFELFSDIHRQCDSGMYWNSERIEKNLDRWRIFAYIEEGKCIGTLYYVCAGKDLEIFGIDYADQRYNPYVTEQLLICGLNKAKETEAESMYFFNDEETHIIAEKLGFKRITEACCFEGEI